MTSSSRRSSQSPDERPTTALRPPDVTMAPDEWIEENMSEVNLSTPAKKLKIRIERGGRNIFGRRRINYFSSGLSPDCKFSFFQSDNNINIYPLNALNTGTPHIFRQTPPSLDGYKYAKV